MKTWNVALVASVALAVAGRVSAQSSTGATPPESRPDTAMQQEIDQLKARLDRVESTRAASRAADKPPSSPTLAKWSKGSVEFYGHVDLSFDVGTKGLSGRTQADGTTADGDQGWLPAIASNSSYLGVRGYNDFIPGALRGVFQIEAQVDMSATPGASLTPDATVKGALAYRNSHVGLVGPWGGLRIGKNDSPYKSSTRRLDPFFGTPGAYTSIMHNSGGDNRAEFDQRFSHAVWYESPNLQGFSFKALFSPGQNRSPDNIGAAYAEPNCTGGNMPPCNDGSYGSAYSASAQYENGPLYLTAAWELHHRVNRTGDEDGGVPPTGVPINAVGVANEWAVQFAAQYTLPTGTTLGGIVEKLNRHNDYINQDFNERDRWGTWVMLTQKLGDHAVSLGWAHAFRTPGDVGTRRSDGTTQNGPVDNSANMLTAGVWHYFNGGQASVYLVYAAQINANGAHYDLGAVSHGIAYDGKNTSDPSGSTFAGSTLQVASLGMTYNF